MTIYILIFIFLILSCILDFSLSKQKKIGLSLICFVLILFIGSRGESGTDSINYIEYFKNSTDVLWNWRGVEPEYLEYGFYYLSVVIKSIYDNVDFYFIIVSCITMLFLYKSVKRICIFPVLGICVYYSRFLILRDMNQIRQALAITIILYALLFLIEQRKRISYLLIVISCLMHYSSVIIIPFLFVCKRKITLRKMLYLLLTCAILGILVESVFKAYLISISGVKLLTYIGTSNLGLANPILYYQIFLCFMFFKYEGVLKDRQLGYYIIRNAYLYSIILLLLTSGFGDIGGRLGTIFATCEIFIIPALCKVIKPNMTGYSLSVILVTLLFGMNYLRMLQECDNWIYFEW